jgi:prepilin-type N-terminal cleavage/methylation domain-containing protein
MKNKNFKNRNLGPARLNGFSRSGGFTLVEIMVAVSIFALVMVVAVGAILSIVAADKRAQALNSVITNLNFAIEGMVRDLRTGYDYDCGSLSEDSLTDCPSSPNSSVTFISSQSGGKHVTYSFENGSIYKLTEGEIKAYPLTAPEITINKLDFYVSGTAHGTGQDYRQPRILIVIAGKYGGYGSEANFSLQTLVSQRKLDI